MKAASKIAWLFIALALVGFGCAVRQPVDSAETHPVEVKPPSEPDDVLLPVPVAPLPVILNDPRNLQLEMLQVFSAKLGRPYQILNLAHRSKAEVRERLQALVPTEAIVLGREAFDVATGVPGVRPFHAGVLEAAPGERGIDALPPFDAQLDYWLQLVPEIGRLGVIGGEEMSGRMADLAEACASRGIELDARLVGSDKETLLAFRGMVPRIDGFVFLPDQNVLSPAVIQQVVGHGRHNEVQILVYSPVMFNLGATLFLQPDPVEVAAALVRLIEDPELQPIVSRMRSKTRIEPPLQLSAAEQTAPPVVPTRTDDG